MVYVKSQIRKDASKWAMVVPQTLLTWVHLWPEERSTFTVITFWIKMVFMVLLEMGQLIYLGLNIKDIKTMAAIMSTLSTTFQGICKSFVVFIHSKKLKTIIETLWNDFWPSNTLGLDVEKSLLFDGRLAVSSMVMVLVSAVVFASGFLSAPLREGRRDLPFLAWYPFDWKSSPLYEILYVTECIVNVYFIVISICGHDDLFLVLCTNCIGQFKMLQEAMAKIGTEDGVLLSKNLQNLENGKRLTKHVKYLEERELLIKCVEHHRKLIRIYDDIEEVFTSTNFVQLFCSVAAICVSSFLIVMTGKDQMIHLTSYCLGHILQLFIFCAAANELAYQSQSLTTYAFSSGWYSKEYLVLKKDMVMVLLSSQKHKKISALGVVNLDNATFLAVLRLSFSFYTLLSTIVAK